MPVQLAGCTSCVWWLQSSGGLREWALQPSSQHAAESSHSIPSQAVQRTWGSINNGQRLPLVTMTPLAVLNVSAGRPCMFQSWTVGGAAKKPQKSKLSLAGMLSCFTCRPKPKQCSNKVGCVCLPQKACGLRQLHNGDCAW